MTRRVRTLLFWVVVGFVLPAGAVAAPQSQTVYGADATVTQRAELAHILGVSPAAHASTVSAADVAHALDGTGVAVSPSGREVAGSAVTCTGSGSGLTVWTQNITRVSPFVYASALVTAGAADSNVAIAAPSSQPVTGETALVQVFKDYPSCAQGTLDPARISLAYKQLAWTIALAGPQGDLNAAATLLLRAEAPIIGGQSQDDAAIGKTLDAASQATNVDVADYLRPALVEFLGDFRGLDFGEWAPGFSIQPGTGNELRAVPVTQALAAGNQLSGTVAQPAPLLTVHSGSRDVPINLASTSTVTRNGATVRADALHKGDHVSMTLNPDGTARQIVAGGPGGQSNGWLVGLVIAVLLIAALLVLEFTRPRHDDTFVLEPNASADRPPA